MVNKKGYMKILEAVIAVVILLLFVTVLVIKEQESEPRVPQDISLLQDAVVDGIKVNNSLRGCVLDLNVDCVNDSIYSVVPPAYDYTLYLCQLPCSGDVTVNLDQPIYAESFIIASDMTRKQETLVSFYLWRTIES